VGAPAISEKQIEIKLLHPASTLESQIQVLLIVDSGSLPAVAVNVVRQKSYLIL
jgi:hypothetical protein